MLSGGLDSSSIACAAQHVADKDALQMHTFSAIFDDVPKSDERTYINEVLEAYSFIPHYIQGDDISPLVLPSLGDNDEKGSDEPIRAPNLHLNWQAYQEADEHEVRIILDGFDGDTTISHGMGSFHEMACNSEWLSLIREARAYANLRDQSAGSIISPMLNRYVFHRIRGYGRLRRWWKTLWNEDTGEESEQQSILAAHFSDRIGWEERKRELSRRPGDPPTTEREFHRRFLTKGDMPRVLETLDRCAAQFQVEVRYPFWDRRLIDFCLSLPRNLKLYQGWSRRIMRIGLDQVLPEKIQWRVDKSDVGHALDHVLYKYSRHQIAQTLNEPVCIDRYADMDVLNRALQRFMAGHPAGQDVLHLWNATTLELWLQRQSNPTP
jgi:asparagine synthase (glutamine-hydrolysing)